MATKSFLKYAGSKAKILPTVLAEINRHKVVDYVEPFLGSGVVAANLNAKSFKMNDGNPDIALLHNAVIKSPLEVVAACNRIWWMGELPDGYYSIRDKFNLRDSDDIDRAAQFIFLNRFGYNGLVRYNKSGGFNVPVGKSGSLPKVPKSAICAMSNALGGRLHGGGVVTANDFGVNMESAEDGSTIYCDSPYVPMSASMSDISYTSDGFKHKDQIRLAEMAEDCYLRGCRVLLSNHDNEVTRKLYQNATRIVSLDVQRTISCKGGERMKVKELIAIYE